MLLCLFGVLVFGGQGVFYMAMLIMLTNTIEYDEWKNNERNEAVTFSVRPFMVKLSGAIQYLIVSISLIACGLFKITKQIGEIELERTKKLISDTLALEKISFLLESATNNQLLGLSIAMTLIPIILLVSSLIIIKKKYIIDEDLYDLMIKEINERKRGE
jgi:melibiose permease/lactose/raffinose/galactose permease